MNQKRSKRTLVSPNWRLLGTLYAVIACCVASTRLSAEGRGGKAQPAQPREVRVVEYLDAEPLFAESADTLDPVAMARYAWKGYLTQMADSAGRTADLQPMYRLLFDNRALPWPSLKQNQVDGFDVNTRNIGAHAALHAMLGDAKANDSAELGQLAYVLTLTPDGPGSMVVHGELAENLLQLYSATGEKRYRDWAELVIRELRPPVDSNDPMGGWLHLHVGWNIGALTRWYAVSDERASLELAIACAERVSQSRDPSGDDGAFRAEGAFGGKSQSTTASWHMHGHTHILPGFVLLGEQLLETGRAEQGHEMIERAQRTFDWLYDADRNPDAGSLTGWLGEWLMVATGWDRQSDCEGCTMGDMVETAVALGAAGRSHTNLSGLVGYYDRAEQIYRGQVDASVFRPSQEYLRRVHSCLEERVAKGPLGSVVWRDRSGRANDATLVAADVKTGHVVANDPTSPSSIVFANGSRFQLQSSAALRLPRFAIYAVLHDTVGGESQSIYSNYDNPINWGKGVNLGLTPDRRISFFTSDGSEPHYDPLTSSVPLGDGWHLVAATYDGSAKKIYLDGVEVAAGPAKGIDYGPGSVAAVGALREFGQQFNGEIAEVLATEGMDERDRKSIEQYLGHKFNLPLASTAVGDANFAPPVFWLKSDDGFERERTEPTAAERDTEVDRLYQEAVVTAGRMEGRLLGLCGFGDWVNKFPSTLDPSMPGIDMMGCCSDAVIRAAYAIWSETVTGDAQETRVNLAFNCNSPRVDVVSCLPHRGELNIRVRDARRVLVRIPEWAPRDKVRQFVDRQPAAVGWQDSYVVFPSVKSGQLLTVTYPLRIAEIKETVGSLDGKQYVERWRGNTIVDIVPRGKWLPVFCRPELETAEVKTVQLAAEPVRQQRIVAKAAAAKFIPVDDAQLLFSPYVWRQTGAGDSARAEATMPGAYARATFTGTKQLALVVDGSINADCPSESRPVIEYSLDRGEFKILHAGDTKGIYDISLAEDLDPAATYQLEIFFRAADLTAQRWTSSKSHLSLAGLHGDAGLQLRDTPRRIHTAIAYGDSITEGVGSDGLFTSWQKLEVNNARATWFPLVAAALDCEYGQLGSGGYGVVRSLELPPLGKTWDRFDANHSRLVDGHLVPEPDYIFCALGTNDFDLDIREPYHEWLAAMRSACPDSQCFCITPPLGVHRDEITAAVSARHAAGDLRVHLIDTRPLQDSFTAQHPTALAYDGVHPNVYGQAMLATRIAAEVQKLLQAEALRQDSPQRTAGSR